MKNALEGPLRSLYADLQRSNPQFFACPQCQDDVMALALNNTRPRYVSGNPPLGEVVTGVQLSYDQARAELTVLLYDAMRRVAASPRHDGESGGSGESGATGKTAEPGNSGAPGKTAEPGNTGAAGSPSRPAGGRDTRGST